MNVAVRGCSITLVSSSKLWLCHSERREESTRSAFVACVGSLSDWKEKGVQLERLFCWVCGQFFIIPRPALPSDFSKLALATK